MPDGLWERDGAFYYDFRHPVTRRRMRKRIGTNRKAALRVLAKIKNDLLNERFGIAPDERAPTFAEFAPRFMEWARVHTKSWGNYEASIRNLMPKFGDLPLNAITMAMAEAYLTARVKDSTEPPLRGRFGLPDRVDQWRRTHKPRKVSKTTANKDAKSLRAILNKAVRWGVIRSNPVAGVELYDEKEFRRKRLAQPEELKALKIASEAEEEDRDARDLFVVGLFMGRRLGEFLSLVWKNVDFSNSLIYFPKTKKGDPDEPPMPLEVAQLLLDRRARAQAAKIQSPYVFPGRFGGHRTSISTAWNSIKRRAGIGDLRYHDLRHAMISYSVMAGVDLMTLAALVGHTTADQIQKTYGHLRKEHLAASTEKFAPVMAGLLGMPRQAPPVPAVPAVPATPPAVAITAADGLHAWKSVVTEWSQGTPAHSTLN